jgi:hypothetical protein
MNQAIDIFKFVQRSLRNMNDIRIEDHLELQDSTLRMINDIINNKASANDVYSHQYIEGGNHGAFMYNQNAFAFQAHINEQKLLERQAMIVRSELDEFLDNVENKKKKMKIARK